MPVRVTRIPAAVCRRCRPLPARRLIPVVSALAALLMSGPVLGLPSGQDGSALAAAPASHSAAGAGSSLETPPLGMHSMLYLNTPYEAMRDMFQQAADMGAPYIRLNIEVSSVFPGPASGQSQGGTTLTRLPRPPGPLGNLRGHPAGRDPLAHPRWGAVDEYLRLARAYHLEPLAVLTSTPGWMASCPRGTRSTQLYRCPPADPGEWGRAVGKIAAHTAGVIDDFEVLNEPDGRWSFLGSPHQYAELLANSYNAIHAADPGAQVVLGGLMHLGWRGIRWMNEMLATPGTYAAYKFDVANIHMRVPPAQVGGTVCRWQQFFASKGVHRPLWVTETGYPANRTHQETPGYRQGQRSQARWLNAVIPTLLASGVDRVFVTERDLSRGGFASEGVLQTPNPLSASSVIRRRLSFYTLQRLAHGTWISAELRETHNSAAGCPAGATPRG